jgi:hypothetical protein
MSTNPHADEDLLRSFNTALVSSRLDVDRNYSERISEILASPEFQAVLNAVKALSASEGISPHEASSRIMKVVRSLDDAWGRYVYSEGVEKIRATTSAK